MLRTPPTESFLMPPSDPQLNKVRLGNPRVTGKEQFYTPPEIADQVMRNVKKLLAYARARARALSSSTCTAKLAFGA